MAKAPGTSRRCNQCRQRRKKCGLEEPQCRQCLSRGMGCSGPVSLPIYVHRTADNLKTQSHRNALGVAMRRRPTRKGRLTPDRHVMVGPSSALRRVLHEAGVSVLKTNVPLGCKPTQLFYATILEVFQPRPETGVFSADRICCGERIYSDVALCIRALLPLAFTGQKNLDTTIFSLLTMYMGRLTGNTEMKDLACSAYTSAVADFHVFLGSIFSQNMSRPRADHCQLALTLCTTMALFEFINASEQPSAAFQTHYEGILSLLEVSRPEVFQSPHLLKLFIGLRGIIIFIAMEKRRPLFLAESDWKQKPFLFQAKSRRELLQEIMLHLPALLFQTDCLISDLSALHEEHHRNPNLDADRSPALQAVRRLLCHFSKVVSELEDWLELFKTANSTPLWWNTNAVMDNLYHTRDPECIPSLEDSKYELRFPDGQKAAILTFYWSSMLEVLMAIIDIQTKLLELPQANARILTLCENTGTHRSMAEEMASMVVQSSPYMFSCLEGRLASQFPLRIVARYYTRQISREESIWLDTSTPSISLCYPRHIYRYDIS